MQIKRLTFEKVFEFLFLEGNQDGTINLQILEQNLKKEPFVLKNKDSGRLLARFLIEDNDKDYIIFDKNVVNSLQMVKSIFRNVVGNYKVLTKAEMTKIHKNITSVITAHEKGIARSFEITTGNGKHHIDDTSIEASFKASNLEMAPEEVEYILAHLFNLSGAGIKFNHKMIFEVFNNEACEKFLREDLNKVWDVTEADGPNNAKAKKSSSGLGGGVGDPARKKPRGKQPTIVEAPEGQGKKKGDLGQVAEGNDGKPVAKMEKGFETKPSITISVTAGGKFNDDQTMKRIESDDTKKSEITESGQKFMERKITLVASKEDLSMSPDRP
jgi:hypothetical protein